MSEEKKQNVLNGALILMAATIIAKIIGAIYKIPLTGIIGAEGRGYFASAYNIYTPVYAISMAGLPIAVSRLVSKNYALGRFRDIKQVMRVTSVGFMLLGLVGTAVLLLLSYPYTSMDWQFSINSPKTIYSIVAIAPSIFFCCVVSTYRGYFAGLNNMIPTAVSEVIEAMGKLIFGLSLSYYVITSRLAEFAASGTVFGEAAASEAEAYALIYPWAAAASVFGVTIGTILSACYAFLRYKLKGDKITHEMLINSPKALGRRDILKELSSIAVPAALSAIVLNVTNLIDATTIQNRLFYVVRDHMDVIKELYGDCLTAGNVLDSSVKTYLYGTFDTTMDFRNLVPTVLMTFGISAIPVISAAYTKKDKGEVKRNIDTVIKMLALVSLPAGFGFTALSEPILRMVYNGTNSESSIPICANILAGYGLLMLFFTLSTPITNMLQAIGRADVPVKTLLAACVVKIICNYVFISIPKLNIFGALIGTAIFYVMCFAINFAVLIKETGIKPEIKLTFIKPAIAAAACGVSAYLSYNLLSRVLTFGEASSRLNGASLSCLISIAIAVLVYAFLVFFMKIIKKEDIFMLPKGEKIAKTLEKLKLIG